MEYHSKTGQGLGGYAFSTTASGENFKFEPSYEFRETPIRIEDSVAPEERPISVAEEKAFYEKVFETKSL